MALLTEVIKPKELTEYIRLSFQRYEEQKGSLARWLPNRFVKATTISFKAGQKGLVAEAQYHEYDTESDVQDREPAKEITLKLPKLGHWLPLSEEDQIALRDSDNHDLEEAILDAADDLVAGISDRIERFRGDVLKTGKAAITELAVLDDFGRKAEHTIQLAQLWDDLDVSRFTSLQNCQRIYTKTNGQKPGAMVMTSITFAKMAEGNEMRYQLNNGASRIPSEAEVNAYLAGQGLPQVYIHDRLTSGGQVIEDGMIHFLPAAVGEDDWRATKLGGTFWGQTLESSRSEWAIDANRPGIVAGHFGDPEEPQTRVRAAAIGLPVLTNANLSMAVRVMASA